MDLLRDELTKELTGQVTGSDVVACEGYALMLAALYQSVRLLAARGERDEAAALMASFRGGLGGAGPPELWPGLEAAVAGAPAPLPEIEFRVVQFHG